MSAEIQKYFMNMGMDPSSYDLSAGNGFSLHPMIHRE
jgi:hypothetical protein